MRNNIIKTIAVLGMAFLPTSSFAYDSNIQLFQSALNYFGFNAGAEDGVIGPKTSNAIVDYLEFVERPITGQLSMYDIDDLVNCYVRSMEKNEMITPTPNQLREELLLCFGFEIYE